MYLKHPAVREYTKIFNVYTTVLNYEMCTLLAKYTNLAKQLIVFLMMKKEVTQISALSASDNNNL